jgi:hypothetical protein
MVTRPIQQTVRTRTHVCQDRLGIVVFGAEAVALATGLIPTISHGVKRLPTAGRVLAWAGVTLWLFDHWVTSRRF